MFLKLINILYLSKSPSIELCLDVGREAWCMFPGIRLDKEAWGLPPASMLFMLSSKDGDPDNRPRIKHNLKFFSRQIPNRKNLLLKKLLKIYILDSILFGECCHHLFKTGLKPFFLVQNDLYNLYSSVVNSERLFCSQKAGVECSYSNFLVYKIYFSIKINKNLKHKKIIS